MPELYLQQNSVRSITCSRAALWNRRLFFAIAGAGRYIGLFPLPGKRVLGNRRAWARYGTAAYTLASVNCMKLIKAGRQKQPCVGDQTIITASSMARTPRRCYRQQPPQTQPQAAVARCRWYACRSRGVETNNALTRLLRQAARHRSKQINSKAHHRQLVTASRRRGAGPDNAV